MSRSTAPRTAQEHVNELHSLERLYGKRGSRVQVQQPSREPSREPSQESLPFTELPPEARVTGHMTPVDMQLANEASYSRKHIDRYLDGEIRGNSDIEARVQMGVTLVTDWMHEKHYESKRMILKELHPMDIESLVRRVFIGVCYCQTPELFTSVSAQLASRLGFSERIESIKCAAWLLGLLCQTDAFDIVKESEQASLTVQSRIPLSGRVLTFIRQSSYLPPMLCPPERINKNSDSGYLTHDSSVLLNGKYHESPQALDALNLQNSVALKLDTDFLASLEESPTHVLNDLDKERSWREFQNQSYLFYSLIASQTRGTKGRMFLTNRYDSRGRMYASGYHITTQGAPFKKAMIEFAKEETVTGVPPMYMTPQAQERCDG